MYGMVWYVFISARSIQNAKVQRSHVETLYSGVGYTFWVLYYVMQTHLNVGYVWYDILVLIWL
jgi:hypothetical protein